MVEKIIAPKVENANAMDDRLLNCPFCGYPALGIYKRTDPVLGDCLEICCTSCPTMMRGNMTDEEWLIMCWNTRPFEEDKP